MFRRPVAHWNPTKRGTDRQPERARRPVRLSFSVRSITRVNSVSGTDRVTVSNRKIREAGRDRTHPINETEIVPAVPAPRSARDECTSLAAPRIECATLPVRCGSHSTQLCSSRPQETHFHRNRQLPWRAKWLPSLSRTIVERHLGQRTVRVGGVACRRDSFTVSPPMLLLSAHGVCRDGREIAHLGNDGTKGLYMLGCLGRPCPLHPRMCDRHQHPSERLPSVSLWSYPR
jgi:hypothetical protein